jgi:hypothetical protein
MRPSRVRPKTRPRSTVPTGGQSLGVHSIPSDGGKSGTLIMHWDGTAWSTINSPNPDSGTNVLEGVSATSGSDAWAVGNYSSYDTPGRSRTLVLHWDGTAWSTVNSPTPGPGANRLAGVSARSGSDAWAVGDHDTAVSTTTSLIAHWNGTAWANAIPRYGLTTSKGNVYNFGDAAWYGSTAGKNLPAPVVAMAPTPDGQGYWLTTSKGNIYNFGDAAWYGSTAGKNLPAPVVDIDGAN